MKLKLYLKYEGEKLALLIVVSIYSVADNWNFVFLFLGRFEARGVISSAALCVPALCRYLITMLH